MTANEFINKLLDAINKLDMTKDLLLKEDAIIKIERTTFKFKAGSDVLLIKKRINKSWDSNYGFSDGIIRIPTPRPSGNYLRKALKSGDVKFVPKKRK